MELTTLPSSMSRLSSQCGMLYISQPYKPRRPVTGIASLFLLYPQNKMTYSISKEKKHYLFNDYCKNNRTPPHSNLPIMSLAGSQFPSIPREDHYSRRQHHLPTELAIAPHAPKAHNLRQLHYESIVLRNVLFLR
jgi:hypothetical protein